MIGCSQLSYLPPVILSDGTVIPQGEKRYRLSGKGIEELEAELLNMPGSTTAERLHLTHIFAPGIYIREIFMPAGEFVLGATHVTEHVNIVIAGRCTIISDRRVQEIVAPMTFKSGAGVRKVLKIHEDVRWQTVHANPDDETDIPTLEKRLIVMTETYLRHFEALKNLDHP